MNDDRQHASGAGAHPVPAISVVVPIYNKAASIERCIESVEANQGVDFELILVDDGSTDGSDAVLRRSEARHVVIHQSNAGPSAARNTGARRARGRLLLFVDADDTVSPGALAHHVDAHRDAAVGAAIGASQILEGERIHDVSPFRWFPASTDDRGVRLLRTFSTKLMKGIPVNAVSMRRDLFHEIGGFDEALRCWEISEFLLRLMLAADTVALVPQVVAQVRRDARNSTFLTHRRDEPSIVRIIGCFTERLEHVPAAEQPEMRRLLVGFLRQLASDGDLAAFKRLIGQPESRGLVRHLGRRERVLAALPRFLGRRLPSAAPWRRAIRRLGVGAP